MLDKCDPSWWFNFFSNSNVTIKHKTCYYCPHKNKSLHETLKIKHILFPTHGRFARLPCVKSYNKYSPTTNINKIKVSVHPPSKTDGWTKAGVIFGGLCVVATIAGWQYFQNRFTRDTAPPNQIVNFYPDAKNPKSPKPAQPSMDAAGSPKPSSTLHQIKIKFYDGLNTPDFFVGDNKKPLQPSAYESGTATFLLAAGTYKIQAEYPDHICSKIVTVPSQELLPADCTLK
jgi:hypothetical protein